MNLYTIGFTQKTAEQFFTKLCRAQVKRVVDVRLNNSSQLAGFAKSDDLRYFLKTVCAIDYIWSPELAPTKAMLDALKKQKGAWLDYERDFLALIKARQIEETFKGKIMDSDCLLCSEPKPNQCHRRLLAEYWREKWGDVEIIHL
jgi:uncharacterized protein (DUF488 family)